MAFFGSPIRNRVMAVIDRKLNEAEKTYKDECVHIDERANSEIQRIENQRIEKKEDLASNLVNDIVSKFM